MREASRFDDRRAAGRALADALRHYAGQADLVVLALPRGGVPVGVEVARRLGAPLDVFLVRKLGTPGHEELAMGAIASGGVRVVNDDVMRWYSVSDASMAAVAAREQIELERRERLYRAGRDAVSISGRTAILVDDGLATGSTMRAAVLAVRGQKPVSVVVAVPVGAREACGELADIADEVVCAHVPSSFTAVGEWYGDFSQTSDDEVRDLLREGYTL